MPGKLRRFRLWDPVVAVIVGGRREYAWMGHLLALQGLAQPERCFLMGRQRALRHATVSHGETSFGL